MGLNDIQAFSRHPSFELTAVADVDSNALQPIREMFPQVRVYRDWRELLSSEEDLDTLNVATPDHTHAAISVTAMNKGLHVYCQKPLAQNLYETRRMSEIAAEKGIKTQMGIQFASSFYERLAVNFLRDGHIGAIKEIHVFSHKQYGDAEIIPKRGDPIPANLDWDLWCGNIEPVAYLDGYYHPFEWRKRLKFGTGCLGDMGCHLLSTAFRSLNLNSPISITSSGLAPNKDNFAVNESYQFVYKGNHLTEGNKLPLYWTNGLYLPPKELASLVGGELPDQGSIFVGTEGVLLVPHMALPVAYPREKFASYRFPRLEPRNHYFEFLDAVIDNEQNPVADFASYAGNLTESVLLGGIASRFPNTRLDWDGLALKFTNNPEANSYIRRIYRPGWEVEGLS